jgi:hypothetical protein
MRAITSRPVDPATHKRFLDYRERYVYFGAETRRTVLTADEFAAADAEQRTLEAMGEESRDDEEEARFRELSKLLFRD